MARTAFNPLEDLKALTARTLSAADFSDPEKLPSRLVVFPWGDHHTAKGAFRVNTTTLSALPKNQAAMNFDRVALDFNHNTVPGSESFSEEPKKVAAYGVPIVLDGEGIALDQIEWTREGKELVSGGHYRDLSPAVKTDADGNVIFMHSAAVCRNGAVPDLILFSAGKSPAKKPTNSKYMDYKLVLCKILGIDPETATDEDITAAAAKATNIGDPDKPTDSADDCDKPASGETDPAVAALTATVKTLSANLDKALTTIAARERNEIIALAAAQGREIPKEWLPDDKGNGGLPNDQLRALAASLPVTVPVEKRTIASTDLKALAASGQLNTADEAVRASFGISKETWQKHNG